MENFGYGAVISGCFRRLFREKPDNDAPVEAGDVIGFKSGAPIFGVVLPRDVFERESGRRLEDCINGNSVDLSGVSCLQMHDYNTGATAYIAYRTGGLRRLGVRG